MSKSSPLTIRELGVHLHYLQGELGVQAKRIAQVQAELDILPTARRRLELLRGLLEGSSNGNGRHQE